MNFLKVAGIFDSRTLTRLSTICNRMEHNYEIPKANDIEVYYDLVAAFVAILENTILFFNHQLNFYSVDFWASSKEDKEKYKFLSISYILEIPKIIIEYHILDQKEKIEKDPNNIRESAYLFKIFMLLHERD